MSVPVPQSVSAQAQAFLGIQYASEDLVAFPPLGDIHAWKSTIAALDGHVMAGVAEAAKAVPASTTEALVEGVTVYQVTLDGAPSDKVYLDFHGGGLAMMGGDVCRAGAALAAQSVGLNTWCVDYRMPPDHPYPAAIDDAVASYRALLQQYDASDIIVGGGSAGATIAAALMLRARDEGLPKPAALILLTPHLDLTESGDSFQTNRALDNVLSNVPLASLSSLYTAGHEAADPYVSPLFGDVSTGFPRTFLQSGTRDLMLSNAVRMHRKLRNADVDAELHIGEAMPHGGFGGAPEDADIAAELRRFVAATW